MYKLLTVVDDFYDRPDEIRKLALSADYPAVEGPLTFPGRNSSQTFAPPGLDEAVSDLVRERVRGSPRPQISHGRFRVSLAGEPQRYLVHVDPSFLSWVGLVYLTRPEHCRGGTALYRHKGLDSDRVPSLEALQAYGVPDVAGLLRQDARDPQKWEHMTTLPMRYNRLVLYRPWLWHSALEPFGSGPEDGRLVHLVFFEPAG